MSYDLTIQFDDEATVTTNVSSIESLLATYPGTERVSPNQWVYKPHSSVHAEIDLVSAKQDDPTSVDSIGVGIPYAFLTTSRNPVLKLCFALAEQLGWKVYDEQIGEYIDPWQIEELLATHAEFGDTANGILANHARLDKWLDLWAHGATHQSLLFLVIAIGLAAVGAIAIVVPLNVEEDNMPIYLFWIGLPIGIAILAIKATFDARIGKQRNIRQ